MNNKCQICGAHNAFCFRKKENGLWISMYLCQTCAIEKGIFADKKTTHEEHNTQCKSCSWTLTDFEKTHKLGCNECYRTFEKKVRAFLAKTRSQPANNYFGKKPKCMSKYELYRKIISLNKVMNVAIKTERYEAAKILSERIKFTKEQSLN